jgi:uncharacterized protein (UPF0333 family)
MKRRLTKENMEKSTAMRTDQAWMAYTLLLLMVVMVMMMTTTWFYFLTILFTRDESV